ncbi:hypothetical protein F5X68DRAFT_50278 [Plectosphaerella plurivora]|uniref:Uncharacterized protein n=1 Tax=Plectosphaerella plurivora TaxID=936078 RepID=A0A9P8V2H0_9PEZI|nr:hypothetical protein F5X68DRAFT_50278 [Plectosphaerella plurivora]
MHLRGANTPVTRVSPWPWASDACASLSPHPAALQSWCPMRAAGGRGGRTGMFPSRAGTPAAGGQRPHRDPAGPTSFRFKEHPSRRCMFSQLRQASPIGWDYDIRLAGTYQGFREQASRHCRFPPEQPSPIEQRATWLQGFTEEARRHCMPTLQQSDPIGQLMPEALGILRRSKSILHIHTAAGPMSTLQHPPSDMAKTCAQYDELHGKLLLHVHTAEGSIVLLQYAPGNMARTPVRPDELHGLTPKSTIHDHSAEEPIGRPCGLPSIERHTLPARQPSGILQRPRHCMLPLRQGTLHMYALPDLIQSQPPPTGPPATA